MSQTNGSRRIRIAICGGGIAGVSLARGLAKHPHIDAHVYEGAPAFNERGAGVGFSINAQRAMAMIHPDVRTVLDLAGAVPMDPSARLMMGIGPSAGAHIIDIDSHGCPQLVVHRAELLDELVKTVPPEMLHVNKKLERLDDDGDDGVTVHFKDGTSETVDAVIGADGIHSRVRKHILGEDHPASEPVFGHCYHHFNIVPLARAAEVLGEEHVKHKIQLAWQGRGGFLFTDFVSDSTSMQVVAAVHHDGPWEYDSWAVPTNEEEVRQAFDGWGKMGESWAMLLADNPNLMKWAVMEHLDAPTYTLDNTCIVGDAAHAFQPWMGAGAGQAMEDALVMERLLGAATSPADVRAAFRTFDHVRRPRTQNIARMSRETGETLVGLNPEVGVEDVEKSRTYFDGRWDYIFLIDLEKHIEEALQIMKS